MLIPRVPIVLMRAFPVVQHAFIWQHLLQLLLTGMLILPAAVPFGPAFPAAVTAATTAATGSLREVGRGVGSVNALNTLGTVAGAFLGGFVL